MRLDDPGGLAGEVVVEADQDVQLGQGLVAGVDPPQRVRQGAGGVGDDVGVAGVGLRGAGVQVGDAAHRQAGQVGDLMPARSGDRDRQGADRGGLVDHHQHRAVAGEFVEQLPQPGLGVRQRRVVQPFAVRGQPDRVVIALADVQAEEDAVPVVHRTRLHASSAWPRPLVRRRTAGSHVTKRPTRTPQNPKL